MILPKKGIWCCYILKSCIYPNRTYIGSTNDVRKRLRQHNGEIAGGAKATSSIKPLEFLCIISKFEDRKKVCQFEWILKHPTGKKKRQSKYSGVLGKINTINDVFYTDYYINKNLNLPKKIYIKNKYKKYLNDNINKDFIVKKI